MDETVTVPVEVEHAVEVPIAGEQTPSAAPEPAPVPSPAELAEAEVKIIEARADAEVAAIEAQNEGAVAVAEAVSADEQLRREVAELKAWQEGADAKLTMMEQSLSSIPATLAAIEAKVTIPPENSSPESLPTVNPGETSPPASPDTGNRSNPENANTAEGGGSVLTARRFRKL